MDKLHRLFESVKNVYDSPKVVNLLAENKGESYSVNGTYKKTIIKNNSEMWFVEISIDSNFPNLFDDQKEGDIIKLPPGEFIEIEQSPSTIYYRALGDVAEISIIFNIGNISEGNNKSPFNDLGIISGRGLMASDWKTNKLLINKDNIDWVLSPDGGQTYNTITNPLSGEYNSTRGSLFTKESSIIVFNQARDNNSELIGYEIFRSTNDGQTWTEIEPLKNIIFPYSNFSGIAEDITRNKIFFGTYGDGGENKIWVSEDDGQTWTDKLTLQNVRHFHTAQIDQYTGDWLATTGDGDAACQWWKSEDGGETWEAIVGDTSGVSGSQLYRTLGVFFDEDYYYWTTDSSSGGWIENWLVKAPKNNLSDVTKIMSIPNFGYAHLQLDPLWIFGTNTRDNDRVNRGYLFISKDKGENWEKIGFENQGMSKINYPTSNGYIYLLAGKGSGGQSPNGIYTLKAKLDCM